mgnify:CR=1 FL=1
METSKNCKTKKLKRKEKNGKFFKKLEKIKDRKQNWEKVKNRWINWQFIYGHNKMTIRARSNQTSTAQTCSKPGKPTCVGYKHTMHRSVWFRVAVDLKWFLYV